MILRSTPNAASGTRRFTRHEYERMAASGILRPDEKVELLDGEIVSMSPQGSRHPVVLELMAEALRQAFREGHWVRTQAPLALSDESEPEPDIAVVRGRPDDYVHAHPTTAVLVVEVAGSSLALDRSVKAELYARAGIAECWIANLVDRVLEVHRDPRTLTSGASYGSVQRLDTTAEVTPRGANSPIALASVLR